MITKIFILFIYIFKYNKQKINNMDSTIEKKIIDDINKKLDSIRHLSNKAYTSKSELSILMLSDVNDELSDVLLNFQSDPLSGSFNDMAY